MARRKRAEPGAARSRVAGADQPPLANIAYLISNGGQITIGALRPIECAAIANDEHDCLAMLRRKPGETLQQLLERRLAPSNGRGATEQFTEEINTPPEKKSR